MLEGASRENRANRGRLHDLQKTMLWPTMKPLLVALVLISAIAGCGRAEKEDLSFADNIEGKRAAAVQSAILAKNVLLHMTRDQVQAAWGKPLRVMTVQDQELLRPKEIWFYEAHSHSLWKVIFGFSGVEEIHSVIE